MIFLLLASTLFAGDVAVKGYTRKDGTYVKGHMRSSRDGSVSNNWSTAGNINPYTLKVGTKHNSSGWAPPTNFRGIPPSAGVHYDHGRVKDPDGYTSFYSLQFVETSPYSLPAEELSISCSKDSHGRKATMFSIFWPYYRHNKSSLKSVTISFIGYDYSDNKLKVIGEIHSNEVYFHRASKNRRPGYSTYFISTLPSPGYPKKSRYTKDVHQLLRQSISIKINDSDGEVKYGSVKSYLDHWLEPKCSNL